MKNCANLLRWTGALAVGFTALASSFAFTFILNDKTGLPIKWPAGSVPIRIMLGSTPNLSDGSSYNTSAQAAIDLWNANLGSIQLQATQAATGSATNNNRTNELAFASDVYGKAFGDNVLAVTTGYSAGNERTESDTLFNTKYTWDSYRGATQSGKVDLRRVALHELGHNLGLDHPDQTTPTPQSVSAIMNSRIGALDTLTTDDITGVQSLYGPPGVPANNNFASATPIDAFSGVITLSGYNTNATKEVGEPNHAGNVGGRSVWWRWKPASSGSVTIDTRGSYLDSTLAVYTGTSLNALTEVASNDDINPGVVQASTVTFNAVGGTTYQIAVDGFNAIVQHPTDTAGADNAGIKLNLAYTAVSGSPPSILTQPTAATVTVGGSVTFSVSASGSDPLSYQWLFNNAAISGATNSSYSISSVQTTDGGTYSVTVTNPAGSVTSNNVSLTVRTATPPPPPPTSGGGGAPSLWFVALVSALGLGRLLSRRPR